MKGNELVLPGALALHCILVFTVNKVNTFLHLCLVDEDLLWNQLEFVEKLQLVSICKQFFHTLSPKIEDNYAFKHGTNRTFSMYQPRSLTVFTAIHRQTKEEYLKRIEKGGVRHHRKSTGILSAFSKPISWNYFTKLSHFTLGNNIQDLIPLPPGISHLTIGDSFNQSVDGKFPDSISHIIFGKKFNKPFTIFPSKLLSITFGQEFLQQMILPDSLTHLTVRSTDIRLSGPLPPKLEHLDIKSLLDFNQFDLLPFPPSLKTLILNNRFHTQQIPLPSTLTSLQVGDWFNDPLDNLPPSIVELSFGASFNQQLDHLPDSLQVLRLGNQFKKPLDNLPPFLLKLIFSGYYNHPLLNLPASLTHLEFEKLGNYDAKSIALPPRLLHINLGYYKGPLPPLPRSLISLKGVTGDRLARLPSFPASLRHLHLISVLEGPIHSLPSSCEISISRCIIDWHPSMPFSQIRHLALKYTDPSILFQFTALTSLIFSKYFNEPVPILPNSLVSIEFGGDFIQSLDNLPPRLQILKLGYSFNSPVKLLPPGLLVLHLGALFDQKLTGLPNGLQQLVIRNPKYSHTLHDLPLSLLDIGLEVRRGGPVYDSVQLLFDVISKPESQYNEF